MGFDNFSYILLSRPSALSGAARVLDICATFDRHSYRFATAESDRIAIANDVRAIGQDFARTIIQVDQRTDGVDE